MTQTAVISVEQRESFRLSDDFLLEFKECEPDWTVEGYITYLRTYSATISDPTPRNERWWETCRRVVEGAFSIARWHRKYVQKKEIDAQYQQWFEAPMAREMYRTMHALKWTPSGRGLQHMGRADAIWEKGAAVLNSCAFVSTARMRENFTAAYEYLMDMAMLGVGPGFDTDGAGTIINVPVLEQGTYTCGDTREGWVATMAKCLSAYNGHGMPERFSFEGVRKKGTSLNTMGGTASGPTPIAACLAEIVWALNPSGKYTITVTGDDDQVASLHGGLGDKTFWEQFENVKWVDIQQNLSWEPYPITTNQIGDLMNIIGKCVVSGGLRRTAEIGLSKIEEVEFFDRKQDYALLSAFRGFSNNSVVTDRLLSREECEWVGKHAAQYGDPGVFWRGNARAWGHTGETEALSDILVKGCNPCGEQPLEDGEMCNLVETVPWRHDSVDDYVNTCRMAFLYAKIVSLLPTHRKDINDIQERNRRVGVSATGVFMAYEKFGKEVYLTEYCAKSVAELGYWDADISEMFDVRWSVRRTSVKPSGSVSLVLGVSPGIRAPEAPYYLRLIQFEAASPLVSLLQEAGYHAEPSVYTPNSMVVYFPVHSHCVRGVSDVSAAEQLSMVVDMQRYWADNMVSNTIEYSPNEIDTLGQLIYDNQASLKSIALMCRVHGFEQAPYQAITREQYEKWTEHIKPLDFSSLHDTVIHEIDEKGCDNGSCTVSFTKE